jgi:hypothetical protein
MALTASVTFDVPRDAETVWSAIGDLRRLPELLDEVDSIERWPHAWRVSSRGRETLLTPELTVPPDGLTASYSDGSLFGLRLPHPKLDVLWIALERGGNGTSVEVGRALQFGNRIAQQAGRALVPLQQRSLNALIANALAILAPEISPEGHLLSVPEPPPADLADGAGCDDLSPSEVQALSQPSFRIHRAAYFVGSVGKQSSVASTRHLADLGTKAVMWHAEQVEQRSWARVRDDYPDAGLRLAQQMLRHARCAPSETVLASYLLSCRQLGLRSEQELHVALGVCHLGYAARIVEEQTFPSAGNRQKDVVRVARAAAALGHTDISARMSAGALVFSRGDALGGVQAQLIHIPGAADPVRLMLSEIAGRIVDRSPDLPEGRPRSVRKLSDRLWISGYATRLMEQTMS